MRLFIAIELSAELKDDLCGVIDKLKICGVDARFSRRENLHLTLAFLGEVPTSGLWQIKAAMDAVKFEPLTLTLTTPGRFRRTDGDILWYGADGGKTLDELQHKLVTELIRREFSPDVKKFRPHLTLARAAVNAPRIPEISHKSCQLVESFALMKSEFVSGRPVYTKLYESKFKK